MLKFFAVLVLSAYLRLCLLLGYRGYVCRICKEWDANSIERPIRYAAAWKVQFWLLGLGYPFCPYCFCVMEKLNEHLQDRTSKCFQLSLPPCPGCYQPWEEGTECANCKINKEIDEQERVMLEREHEREKEWEAEYAKELGRKEYLELYCREDEDGLEVLRRDIEEASWPAKSEQERDEDYYEESLRKIEQEQAEEDARYWEAVHAEEDREFEEHEKRLDDLARRFCDPSCPAQGRGCNCAEEDDCDGYSEQEIIREQNRGSTPQEEADEQGLYNPLLDHGDIGE